MSNIDKRDIISRITADVERYYTNKIKMYGPTAKGVDWKDENSQLIRFTQLAKILDKNGFTVADIGCGYGKFVEFLDKNFEDYTYFGYDLSEKMISEAIKLYRDNKKAMFKKIDSLEEVEPADYLIASGIFNVKFDYSEAQWLSYILYALEIMNQKAIKGFAFNMLTKYSDKDYMRDDLYYADPLFIFDFCKRNFSKHVALLHDYGLYEFTILVRR
jgi:hypothetical protein